MNFSAQKSPKQFQFAEVDEDLRRIAEREASKALCPYGTRCYRKNVNHLQQYRHEADSPQDTRNKAVPKGDVTVKRGKITDFFTKKTITPKKISLDPPKDVSDYEIEDDSEDEANTSSTVVSKRPANTSFSTPSKLKKKSSPRMSRSGTKGAISHKKAMKGKRVYYEDIDDDFDDSLKAIINDDMSGMPSKRSKATAHTNVKSRSPLKSPMKSPTKSTVRPIEGLIAIADNKDKTTDSEICIKSDAKQSCDSMTSPVKTKLTPKQLNEVLKEIFLVEMPKDFFALWQFCKSIKPEKPEDALTESLGLRLVGPYDVLTGKLKKSAIKDREQVLCHWRYYYDLPEFQTIVASNKNGYHLGYFRDTPDEENPVVVSNSGDNSTIEGMADNICAAIYSVLQNRKFRGTSAAIAELEVKLRSFCSKNKINFSDTCKLRERKSKIMAKSLNGFGFVVPYDKKTELGYRPLPQTDSELKKLFAAIIKVDVDVRNECKSMSELQEIIQLVSYANDECDFGMGLELGIDLFSCGEQYFHKSVLYLLSMAYDFLKREPFSRVIKAHINNRRKGFHLDYI
ncbi:unnamed protein product [Oppiella nova]|uniref:PBZ-type domain-containing protein n=1 Tax=Oppiella nova TaxID=334625 RepID=A0A7R9MFD1_9ACAR|nr:unnamed protein product [Oppiella nova]CAG2175129.1 unnamed protein product [Oppiella nova]